MQGRRAVGPARRRPVGQGAEAARPTSLRGLITGAHTIVGSADPDADRAFLRDVLALDWVDAGGGWPIFALPPSEVAIHPGKDGLHQLYLMCSDLDATIEELRSRNVDVKLPAHEERWGRLVFIRLPGGSEIGIYEPRHPSPPRRRSPRKAAPP